MESFCFTIYGLIICILLMVIYFPRKREKTLVNKLYSNIILVTFFATVVEIVSFILVNGGIDPHNGFYLLTIRVLFACFFTWLYFFCEYIISISLMDKVQMSKITSIVNTSYLVYLLLIVIIFILPFDVMKTSNGLLLPQGLSVNFLYLCAVICILFMIVIFFLNIKNYRDKRYIPLYLLVVMFAVLIVVQYLFPKLLLINSVCVLIDFVMYFTIENPDLQIIEEYREIKGLAEKQNVDKVMFLHNINQSFKYPLMEIGRDCNHILDCHNQEEIKEYVKDIDIRSKNLLNRLISVYDPSGINENKLRIFNDTYDTKSYENIFKSFKNMTNKKIKFTYKIDYNLPNFLYGDILNIKEVLKKIYKQILSTIDVGYININLNVVIKNNICRIIIEMTDNGYGYSYDFIEESLKNGLFKQFSDELRTLNGTYIINSDIDHNTTNIIVIDQNIIDKSDKKIVNLETISNKKRIMIVDNTDDSKELIKLLSRGTNIIEHYSLGTDCLSKIRAYEKYDLIVINDKLTPISGIELFNKLKMNITFNTPTIMLSNIKDFKIKELYLKSGIKEIIAIPFDKNKLDVINKYLDD